jgi:hypothetical protein
LEVLQSTPSLKKLVPTPEAFVVRIKVFPKFELVKYLKFVELLHVPLSQPEEKPGPTIAF